jgi:hypothetical protein
MAELDTLCVPAPDKLGRTDQEAVMSTFYFEAMRMVAQGSTLSENGLDGLAKACAAAGIEWKPVGVRAFLEKWWEGRIEV